MGGRAVESHRLKPTWEGHPRAESSQHLFPDVIEVGEPPALPASCCPVALRLWAALSSSSLPGRALTAQRDALPAAV